MPSAFIDDGYTLTATLEKEGVYDAVQVTYRPLLRNELWQYSAAVDKMTEGDELKAKHLPALDKMRAELIAGADGVPPKLIDWDLKDSRGDIVEITVDNLLRLHSTTFDDLVALFFPKESTEEEQAKN